MYRQPTLLCHAVFMKVQVHRQHCFSILEGRVSSAGEPMAGITKPSRSHAQLHESFLIPSDEQRSSVDQMLCSTTIGIVEEGFVAFAMLSVLRPFSIISIPILGRLKTESHSCRRPRFSGLRYGLQLHPSPAAAIAPKERSEVASMSANTWKHTKFKHPSCISCCMPWLSSNY